MSVPFRMALTLWLVLALVPSTAAAQTPSPMQWSAPGGETVEYRGGSSDISCPTASFCAAVRYTPGQPRGGPTDWEVAVSTNPTVAADWQVGTIRARTGGGLDCPSVRLCVMHGIGPQGGLSVSTDPLANSWVRILPDVPIYDVACASETLCVAVDGSEFARVTTDPAGGAAAWTTRHIADAGVGNVACAAPSLCVAMGGDRAYSTLDPLQDDWGAQSISDSGAVECPTADLCVVLTREGRRLVGTPCADPPCVAPPRAEPEAEPPAVAALQLARPPAGLTGRKLRHRRRIWVPVAVPAAGEVNLTWKRRGHGDVLAKGHRTFDAGGSAGIHLKVTKTGRRLMRHRVRIVATATFRGEYGALKQAAVRFRLPAHR